ncbi:MAG: hypothetical protein ABEH81_06840 [Halopenitus sp.]
MTTDLDVAAARDRLLAEHAELLATVLDCAEAVAADFETTVDGAPATRDSRSIRDPLQATLERAGVLEQLPAALVDAVQAAGASMPAKPVAAPPYVVVTSTGPTLRATLDGTRLIVRVEVFAVEDSAFVRRNTSPAEALSVSVESAESPGN